MHIEDGMYNQELRYITNSVFVKNYRKKQRNVPAIASSATLA